MDFVNLFIINKLSSKNDSENSVCKCWLCRIVAIGCARGAIRFVRRR